MKKLSALILFTGITLCTFAQNDEVKVDYTYVENGVEINATNQSSTPKIINLKLTVLDNYSTFDDNPTTKTVMPNNTSSICKLTIINKDRRADFNYRYQYVSGTSDVRYNPQMVYLLPVREGKSTRIGSGTSIGSYLKKDLEDKAMGYVFEAEPNDTIYATRKGVVYDIVDGNEDYSIEFYKREQNRLSIYHKDGTISQYFRIKKGSALVKNGDEVEAGQPLALAAGKMGGKANFLISFYYFDERKARLQKKPFELTRYLPKFATAESQPTELAFNQTYTSTHPVDIVTLEMTKKEKKKYLEKKGIKK
ncbi:M23 family metallopeptidase [uncultured Acetobacteroides sp.]|uniref:M23 family metallopeptidase n=1 Tax=uncultured Acetobacteroides sp. TaxID=1760811 RepID=UPI0029F53338|nr:M23 family metallopeptidase [uncultured Acetobacteroides sp.]